MQRYNFFLNDNGVYSKKLHQRNRMLNYCFGKAWPSMPQEHTCQQAATPCPKLLSLHVCASIHKRAG